MRKTRSFSKVSQTMLKISTIFSLITISCITLLIPAWANTEGVFIRFRVAENLGNVKDSVTNRTYENAVLMKSGESFAADFAGQFRIVFLPTETTKNGKPAIDIAVIVHDIRRDNVLAGKANAVILVDGEEILTLASNDQRTYTIMLKVAKRPLPKNAG
jgi:hypothetical protein